jgi:Major intrinsic protein
MSLSKRSFAEFIGTFWLVFGGCGSAVLAAAFPQLGIGFLGVALAFGLTVLTMAYAIGHIRRPRRAAAELARGNQSAVAGCLDTHMTGFRCSRFGSKAARSPIAGRNEHSW